VIASDPLDTGEGPRKRWEEFRAQYSAALLLHWVFRDLKTSANESVQDLWSRLQSSLYDYPEILQREALDRGEQWDGVVPVHARDGDVEFWIDLDDLHGLYASLFPHDLKNASIGMTVGAAVVVGLHSALEAYVRSLHLDAHPGLPVTIRDHLSASGYTMPAELFDVLVDCDATRHVIVHNRGVVDDAYIRKVRNPPYHKDEFRVLTDPVIESFADAVRTTARMLKDVDRKSSAA